MTPNIHVFGNGDVVIYTHTDEKSAEKIVKLLGKSVCLVGIDGVDWNKSLSPWKSQKVFAKGEDFAGLAKQYLKELTEKVIPDAERKFNLTVRKRYIAGYSLSGLFALWSLFNTDVFDGCACVSGSLWFDGFVDYALSEGFVKAPDKIYLSLGDREKFTRQSRMATVEDCTQRIAEYLSSKGVKNVFEHNVGGHFDCVEERMVKGIKYLAEN